MNEAETERYSQHLASMKNKQLLAQAKRDIVAMNEKATAFKEKLARVKELTLTHQASSHDQNWTQQSQTESKD